MQSKYLKKILIFISLLFVGNISAQNNELRSYTLDDGLPQSQVYDMVQDKTGYLWLGTQGGGLTRFDGETFKTFNENDGLYSNYINSLLFANDSLFIGTKRGLSIKTNRGFKNLGCPSIISLFKQGSVLYIGTNKGLYFLNKSNELKKIQLNEVLDSNMINDIIFDGKYFWVASNKGLFKSKSLSDHSEIEQYDTSNFTSLVLFNEKLYAATFIEGVVVLDPNGTYEENFLLQPNRINAISIINDQLWAATDGAGIAILNAETFQIQKKIDRSSGLSVSHIRKSLKDRQGNIWIATGGGGFYKYFENKFTHFDKETGLNGNRIYTVHHSNNELWISNSEAGLVTIDSAGIRPIEPIEGFSDVKIKSITSDYKSNIWAGSDGKGILFREIIKKDSIVYNGSYLFDLKIDTISITKFQNHLINEANGFISNWIRQLYTNKDTIWAATYSNGIVKFQYDTILKQAKILKTFGENEGLEDLLIKDMEPDETGRIWYSTQTGQLGFIKNDKITHLGEVLLEKTPINTLLFKEKTLFLATAGNGIWYSTQDDYSVFKKLSGKKQITSNNIYQLIFDNEDNLWMGSEQGVDKIVLTKDKEIIDVFHFGKNDGFLGIETCLNAVDKDERGNLWFGTIHGLTKYDTGKNIDETSIKPIINFESIEVNYKSIDSITSENFTTKKDVLQLLPNQNQISFTYRTVDLNHPKEIEYRFKLNNTEWSPWSRNNQQNLSGLAYGGHIFYAQSRNFRWEKSEPIQFKFFIESPLYKKAWFQWSVMIVGLLIISLFTLLYLQRLKKKTRDTKERLELQNHLLSLEQKALRLQMNPHFIFNVLNGIKAMGTSNPKKMNTTINTFATLLREILNNSRKDQITLEQEIKTLRNYIEVEKLMSPKTFTYSIELNSDINAEEILIPPMLIQPFVENAIRHGILKAEGEGNLQIHFKTDNEFLYCKLLDNGIGIFQSQNTSLKTDHQSMALEVTKERIESISGKNSLEIKEIILTDTTIAGTQITFKIPLQTDY